MEQDPSPSLHNSNTISEPAAVEANPGHLMYSHAPHLTQGLSSGSYQYPTDTHAHSHAPFTSVEIHILPLNCLACLHIKMPTSARTYTAAKCVCKHTEWKETFQTLKDGIFLTMSLTLNLQFVI